MKRIMDFTMVKSEKLHSLYSLLTLVPQQAQDELPDILPGQFVQVRIDNKSTFLRRPISVNDADPASRSLSLLVRDAGDGTRWLIERPCGATLNLVLPLGNGFDPSTAGTHPLLVGGGVGIAPMLYYAKCLHAKGVRPTILVGARSEDDLLELDALKRYGEVWVTTDDGTAGDHGVVTDSSVWSERQFTSVACCGPEPMMKAVARLCREKNISCLVSLENMMACGVGACLCCVEKTVKGNVCVCTEGPVFSTDSLTWN